jgi:hypothetical protein
MEPSIRPDQQSKIAVVSDRTRFGNIKIRCAFSKTSSMQDLSAVVADFLEIVREIANPSLAGFV